MNRLAPHGHEIYEVRWVDPRRSRPDVLIRRYRRRADALAWASQLVERGMTGVGVYAAHVQAWRLIAADDSLVRHYREGA